MATTTTGLAITALLLASCGTRMSDDAIHAAGNGGSRAVLGNEPSGSSTDSSTDGSATGPAASDATGSTSPDSATVTGATGIIPTGSTAGTATGTSGGTARGTTGGSASKTGTTGGTPGTGTGTGTTGGAAASSVSTGRDAPIFGGGRACSPANGSTVNIGNVSTLSGVLGQLFSAVVPALQTFVKAQNACGGLNGHVIKLFVEDDQGDPSTAVSACKDMVQNNKIIAFVGDMQTLTVDGMKSCVDKTGVPIIGGDLTSNTWFTDPLIFPQASPPQAVSFGYVDAALNHYRKKVMGNFYCLEVPQACVQIDKAFREMAAKLGATMALSTQISITAPSYTSQCLDAQKKGVEVLAITADAPTQNRVVDSCAKIGYHPSVVPYALGLGSESQFLGNKNLANVFIPIQTFPWMGKATAAERFYQASVNKYNPGFATGDAASLGWTAGALLVAGARDFTDSAADSRTLIGGLQKLKSDNLGGLTAPLTFLKGGHPKIPYCLFAVLSNADDSGWMTPVSVPACTKTRAPSDPNQ